VSVEPNPARARAVWIDRATTLLLLGVVFTIFVVAMPVLGHGLGLRPAQVVPAPISRAPAVNIGDLRVREHPGVGDFQREVLGFGRIVRDTPLSTRPTPGARSRGRLDEGEHVLLIRTQGSWVEVVRRPHEKDESVGWVPASTIDVL